MVGSLGPPPWICQVNYIQGVGAAGPSDLFIGRPGPSGPYPEILAGPLDNFFPQPPPNPYQAWPFASRSSPSQVSHITPPKQSDHQSRRLHRGKPLSPHPQENWDVP